MTTESLWLGRLRAPVRFAAFASVIGTVLIAAYLMLGLIFGWSDVDMDALLRPEGRTIVYFLNWGMLASVLLTGLYLTDDRGAIEVEHTGIVDIVSLVISRIAMLAIVAIVLVMFYEVVARYIFEKPTLWANELSLWIAGFIFLFAGLYAMQQRSHIRIFIIYDLMPRWMQKASDVVSVFLIWVFAAAMIWGGYKEAYVKWQRMEVFGTAWDPPIPATIKVAILLLVVLVAIQALSNLIYDWNKDPEGHSPADEIDEHEIEKLKKTLGEG